ncbi:unnamed protein product, partial [Effrenium voratum]
VFPGPKLPRFMRHVVPAPRQTQLWYGKAISKCKKWQPALALLADARDKSLANAVLFSAAMGACGARWRWAVRVFAEFLDAALRGDVILFNSAISACGRGEQWRLSLQLLSQMTRVSLRWSLVTCNAALGAVARCQKWQIAVALVEDMEKRKMEADVISRNCLLKAGALAWRDALDGNELTAERLGAGAGLGAPVPSAEPGAGRLLFERRHLRSGGSLVVGCGLLHADAAEGPRGQCGEHELSALGGGDLVAGNAGMALCRRRWRLVLALEAQLGAGGLRRDVVTWGAKGAALESAGQWRRAFEAEGGTLEAGHGTPWGAGEGGALAGRLASLLSAGSCGAADKPPGVQRPGVDLRRAVAARPPSAAEVPWFPAVHGRGHARLGSERLPAGPLVARRASSGVLRRLCTSQRSGCRQRGRRRQHRLRLALRGRVSAGGRGHTHATQRDPPVRGPAALGARPASHGVPRGPRAPPAAWGGSRGSRPREACEMGAKAKAPSLRRVEVADGGARALGRGAGIGRGRHAEAPSCAAWKTAAALLSAAQQTGAQRDIVSLNRALNVSPWRSATALCSAEKLRGLRWSAVTFCTLGRLLAPAGAGAGAWARALALIHQIRQRNVEHSVVAEGTAAGAFQTWSKAQQVLEECTQKDLQRSSVLCGIAISACEWKRALALQGLAGQSATSNRATSNAALSAAAAGRRWRAGLALAGDGLVNCGARLGACQGQWRKALALHDTLRPSGWQPSAVTYGLLVGAVEWAAAAQLLREAVQAGAQSLPLLSAAVSACEKAREWRTALSMCQAAQADVVMYGACISACEKGKQWQRAVQLLSAAWGRVAMSSVAYGAAISACEACEEWNYALLLLADLFARALRANVVTYNAALQACQKGQRWQKCLHLLAEMCGRRQEPNAISYNAVLSACGAFAWRHTLRIFFQLDAERVALDSVALGAALAAAPRKTSALLRRLEDLGVARLARKAAPSSPDQRPYTRAISAAGRASRWDAALALLRGLTLDSVEANSITYNAAINACQRGQEWQLALLLLAAWAPDIIALNACASAAGSGGGSEGWQMALLLLSQVSQRQLEADCITFNACITSCQKSSHWQKALDLFEELRQRLLRASVVSYGAAMCCWDAGQHWARALQLLPEAASHGLQGNVVTCGAAISAVRLWQQALALLDTSSQTSAVAFGAALSACEKGHAWRWAAQGLAQLLLQTLRPDVVAFNPLLGALGARGRWEAALQLATRMASARLRSSVVTLGTVMAAMDLGSRWAVSFGLLAAAPHQALQPNVVAFGSAASACQSSELWEWRGAAQLLACVQRASLQSTPVLRSAACSACVSASAWRAAIHTDRRSDGHEELDVVGTGGAISACEKGGCWPRALQLLSTLASAPAAARGSAATACAKAARWSEAFLIFAVGGELEADAVAAEQLAAAAEGGGRRALGPLLAWLEGAQVASLGQNAPRKMW